MDYKERIKKLKSQKKITNDQLAVMTGIPLGTLSKLLAGISDSPKLSNMVAICDALGCSLDYIVKGTEENTNNYTLDPDEIELIEDYRMLDAYGKDLAALIMKKEKERVLAAPSATVLAMPSVAQTKTAAKKSSASIRVSEQSAEKAFARRKLFLYDMPVSAGTGVYLDESRAEEIAIPDTVKTQDADFALRISGNSMEPRYHDGDVLLIQNCDSVEVGELGIFVLDGSGYFKIFGGDRLISMNPKYGDILLKDFEEVNCTGRVVGKLKKK
ncbi:MAG: LexA family transcriptional regulator [Clostridia bacterium]|nr:LexA family transcriptional regulator [Clostridia bacterium]